MQTTRWVVVANREKAKIYQRNKQATEMELIEELDCPDARLHEQELANGTLGESFASAGDGQRTVRPVHTEHQKLLVDFAGDVAEKLEKGRKAHLFEHLDVIADPGFLGALRDKLASPTLQLIEKEVSKNVVDAEPKALRKYLVDA
ncbi:host attachment protein [Allohahella marinimesophila]|uniref:Host attachment protein n=1 Tax=Allohahella marinimesophila TaxID=1054972 RepID=A0ABP7PM15_9GAMM